MASESPWAISGVISGVEDPYDLSHHKQASLGFPYIESTDYLVLPEHFAKRIHKKEEELVREYLTIQENEANDLVE
jgi:hypothetical protein